MPPKRKSSQPEDSYVHYSVEKVASPQEIPVKQPPKKKTRKPRTTKKKDLSLQEGSNIIDLSTSPVIKADTPSHEEVTPIKKKPGRKPKVKQEIVEESHEQQQQQYTTNTLTTTTPQHQLLF